MLEISTIPVTPFLQNFRILSDNERKECVFVDPGAYDPMVKAVIDQFLVDQGLTLKAILLTHGHIDHIGGVAEIAKLYPQARIIGPHFGDQKLIEEIHSQAKFFNFKQCNTFEPEYVTDGQEIKLFADSTFKVLHTPGHTKGGVCFYCQQENFVLTGDTIFKESIGRTDFEGGNLEELLDSIRNKIFTLPDETEIFSGHGEDSFVGYEKDHNYFLK